MVVDVPTTALVWAVIFTAAVLAAQGRRRERAHPSAITVSAVRTETGNEKALRRLM